MTQEQRAPKSRWQRARIWLKRKFDAFMDRMVENTPPAEKWWG